MSSKFKIFPQNDKDSTTAEAGEHLNQLLIEHKKQPILLMLSGGSALGIIDYIGKTALGENLTISMLDERFSEDPQVNNFHQMQKTDFYNEALEAECSFFGTVHRSGETMEQLAERWEKNLKNWQQDNPKGLIIATLGMGPDGHTAGMFPYPEDPGKFDELFKADNLVTAYDVGDKNQYKQRVTTTIRFLRLVDFGMVFVSGAEKKQKLDQVVKHQGQLNELPALSWHEIKNVSVFTDINLE